MTELPSIFIEMTGLPSEFIRNTLDKIKLFPSIRTIYIGHYR
jgi:hypothetical protein